MGRGWYCFGALLVVACGVLAVLQISVGQPVYGAAFAFVSGLFFGGMAREFRS